LVSHPYDTLAGGARGAPVDFQGELIGLYERALAAEGAIYQEEDVPSRDRPVRVEVWVTRGVLPYLPGAHDQFQSVWVVPSFWFLSSGVCWYQQRD
tara:strand:- start:13035 stop:13322 length:288 start_codon:yes stop_codon:yes gene_type:complete